MSRLTGFDNTLVHMGGPSHRDLQASYNAASRADRVMRIEMEAISGDRDSLDGGENDDDNDAVRTPRGRGQDGGPQVKLERTFGRAETVKFVQESEEKDKIDNDLLGDLGLADFMLLAYTISNIYQRHRKRAQKSKLDDSEVVGHDETLLFIVVAVYATAVLTMALTLMGGGIICRPLTVSLGDFAKGKGGMTPGGHFAYGMDFINRICETEIKLHTSQFWPVFTLCSFVILFIGAAINSSFIARYNRYHAIARGQFHSPLVGNQPVRAIDREPGRLERFYLKFIIIKFIAIIICMGMLLGFWYSILTFSKINQITQNGQTSWSGGNLLTRAGAICDASTLVFEETFDAQYRCHLMGEAQMHYLKYFVIGSSALVILVSIIQTVNMIQLHGTYLEWKKQNDEFQENRKKQGTPQEVPAEAKSMFKMTRGLIRLIMYYMKPTPPEGDLPNLISKAMFGLQPDADELANISTKMISDFASPKETSDMLMHIMKGALGEHIGNSEDVHKIVLATVTAWKDTSTQRYLKGIVDTINAIHKDQDECNHLTSPHNGARGGLSTTPQREQTPRR